MGPFAICSVGYDEGEIREVFGERRSTMKYYFVRAFEKEEEIKKYLPHKWDDNTTYIVAEKGKPMKMKNILMKFDFSIDVPDMSEIINLQGFRQLDYYFSKRYKEIYNEEFYVWENQ